MRDILLWISSRYNYPDIFVTENGQWWKPFRSSCTPHSLHLCLPSQSCQATILSTLPLLAHAAGSSDPNDASIPLNEALCDTVRVNYYNDYIRNAQHAIE